MTNRIKSFREIVGGVEQYEIQLDYFFDNELFNMDNLPDIQTPYLYTNSPWKTQRVLNLLPRVETNNWYGTYEKWDKLHTRKFFQAKPKDYIKEMDDDVGTMSFWYVWSKIGLYPVFFGLTEMVITTPQLDKVESTLPDAVLEIKTKKQSEKSIYIKEVKVNG